MKKFILLFCLSFFILGWEKEQEDCNCGIITNDAIIGGDYTLTIRNNCTDNVETFIFSYSEWYNNYVGDEICLSSHDSWK